MKPLRKLSYLVLFFFIASCSTNSDLIGTWQIDQENSTPGLFMFSTITFQSNRTWNVDEGSQILSGEFNHDKNENTLTWLLVKKNNEKVKERETNRMKFKIEVLTKMTLRLKVIEPKFDDSPNCFVTFKRI